ncbi:MAG: glycosyltransferase family 39 protein [Verrucomicrobiia bacterium]
MNYKKINKITTICLIAGIVILGWIFRYSMNTDAVAYIRLAEYYASGNFDLAISGYWGPLICWMMALFIKLGIPPLFSARIVMGISAIVFYFASDYFFKRSNLREEWGAAGRLTAGCASLVWSVQQITPDLLMAGLLTFAAAKIIPQTNGKTDYDWLLSGVLFGIGYLCKPVAFPIAILMIGLFLLIVFISERHKFFTALKAAVKIGAVFLIISGLWITVLSVKYHRLTITTSAAIAHSIAAPGEKPELHPFSIGFHNPQPGRIIDWEDPSRLPYNFWSPISSISNLLYQLKVIGLNTLLIIGMLFGLHPVLFILCFATLRWIFKWGDTGYLSSMSWFRLLAPVFVICVVYLPVRVSIKDVRYFYPVLPFVFSSVALFFSMRVESWKLKRPGTVRFLPLFLAVGTALVPIIPGAIQTIHSYQAGLCSHKIAEGIKNLNISGNIAGSGLIPGGRVGVFTAFLLNRPWNGDSLNPKIEEVKNANASIFIAAVNSPLYQFFQKNSQDFEDITEKIFQAVGSSSSCSSFVKVFLLKSKM